mmetsp:Transcript_28011/g.61727  ORF Transcript_28011/g.61727 Transcript_28011/m.61727 type:complete len:86 (-) Transcript_28011:35-292(-)
MLAIGDVQGNINILKIGESLLRFDEQERREVDEAFRREKERETQITKKRKKTKSKRVVKEEEDPDFDTEKLEMEFYKELGLEKKD